MYVHCKDHKVVQTMWDILIYRSIVICSALSYDFVLQCTGQHIRVNMARAVLPCTSRHYMAHTSAHTQYGAHNIAHIILHRQYGTHTSAPHTHKRLMATSAPSTLGQLTLCPFTDAAFSLHFTFCTLHWTLHMYYNFTYVHFHLRATYSLPLQCCRHCTACTAGCWVHFTLLFTLNFALDFELALLTTVEYTVQWALWLCSALHEIQLQLHALLPSGNLLSGPPMLKTLYIYTVFIFATNFLSTASQRYAVLHISHTTLYHTEPYFDPLYFWMQYQSSARCAVCTMHTTVHKCTVPAQYTVHTGQWTVYNAWCTTVGEDTLCTVYTTKVGEDEHQRVWWGGHHTKAALVQRIPAKRKEIWMKMMPQQS